MAYEHLLREGRINGLETRNRLIAGPMERVIANRDGSMTQRYIDYLAERARGGVSIINIESTYVSRRGQGNPYQAGCHDDRMIPGMSRLAAALHAEGAALSVELYHAGRQSSSVVSQRQPLAPSVVPCSVLAPVPVPREMTLDEINDVVEAFVQAARRCVAAGVDMIHLHGAHGYLLGQFLSPWSNRRTDTYGGSAEARTRFPLEVLTAVREVVGPDFAIVYRISLHEFIEGGLTPQETIPFCRRLIENGVDLIDVSGGVYERVNDIIQGADRPRGAFVEMAAELKRAVGDTAAVSVTQRLSDPELAESVMARHNFDYISMTRAFHADPHLVRKLEQNRAQDVLPCISCNTCLDRLYGRIEAHCACNPHSTFERTRAIQPAAQRRSVVVVGGGPAGMQAARILARQGQNVSLYESRPALGGQVTYAARTLPDFQRFATWLEVQLQKLGVEIHLRTRIDAAELDHVAPEVIVVASGARGSYRYADVAGDMPQFDLFSAFDRADEWAGEVAILGGDWPSCSLALQIAKQGKASTVHLIDPDAELAIHQGPGSRGSLLELLEAQPSIQAHTETTLEEVGTDFVVVQHQGEGRSIDGIGAVIYGGRIADNDVFEALMESQPEREIYLIGDALVPGSLHDASHQAAEVAELIRLRAPARDAGEAPVALHA